MVNTKAKILSIYPAQRTPRFLNLSFIIWLKCFHYSGSLLSVLCTGLCGCHLWNGPQFVDILFFKNIIFFFFCSCISVWEVSTGLFSIPQILLLAAWGLKTSPGSQSSFCCSILILPSDSFKSSQLSLGSHSSAVRYSSQWSLNIDCHVYFKSSIWYSENQH